MKHFLVNFKQKLTEKNKERLNTIMIFLLLLPSFKLGIFDTNGTALDTIYNIGRVLCTLFILIVYAIYFFKNKYISKTFVIYVCIKAYIFINTFIQSGFDRNSAIVFLVPVIAFMIIDFFAHKNPKELVHALLIIFEIFVILNFILMIFCPEGVQFEKYNSFQYLLGNRNGHITFFIIALTLSLMWQEYNGSKIHFFIILPICIISSFIGKSTTGFFALALFIFLYFTKLYKTKFINIVTGITAYIVIFFAIVIFRVQDYMAPIWELFGKNATFSTRTIIWDTILEKLSGHLIFGYGERFMDILNQLYGLNTTHNCILEYLVQGGIVKIILVALFLFITIYQMKNVKSENCTRYITIGIFAILVHLLAESPMDPYDFVLFILLTHATEFSEHSEKKIKTLEESKKTE